MPNRNRKSRFAQPGAALLAGALMLGGAQGAHAADAAHPDFSGSYLLRRGTAITLEKPDPEFQLTPEAQKQYAKNKAGVAAGDPEIDTALKCQPLGVPRLLYPGPIHFEVVQSPRAVAVIGEWLGPPRLIYLGAKHRDGYYPTYMGDSVAHWEGGTLVVDTVNFATTTFLDNSGFPHSDRLHVIERWQLVNGGKTIANRVTFDDPKTFTAPWSRTFYYDKSAERPTENVCENTRVRP
jgi:hypothetical protein